jgi:hypothetical protein
VLRLLAPSAVIPLLALACAPIACAGDGASEVLDHHDHGDDVETLGTTTSALAATDPVSAAVTSSCTTASVRGLSTQLIDEIQCLRPGTTKSIEGVPGFSLGSAVFPYLQAPAADALVAAQEARGVTMTINSALRTLPQQYLLYRWYQTKRCNIRLAAAPGKSNHESAIAVDISDNASWRAAMEGEGFRWYGAGDPVHFDFVASETVDLRGLSVLAFQRLWNRNNPDDPIGEDGDYGPETAERLAQSPVGGFARGAECAPPAKEEGAPAPRPPTGEGASDDGTTDDTTDGSGAGRNLAGESGCAAHGAPGSPSPLGVIVLGAIGAAIARRRRVAAR